MNRHWKQLIAKCNYHAKAFQKGLPIYCNDIYMVCLMRRPLFQMLYLLLLMSF